MTEIKTKVDTAIREKWHKGFEREKQIDTIVIHGTGGGNTYQYILDGARKKLYKKGVALFHYLIERNGEITEIIDPDRFVYHSSSGYQDESTIGIELLNPHKNNEDQYMNAQYTALFFLIFDYLFIRYDIKIIVSHERMAWKYSKEKKNCPGNFDWDKLETEIKKRGLTYDHDKKYDSYWNIRKQVNE